MHALMLNPKYKVSPVSPQESLLIKFGKQSQFNRIEPYIAKNQIVNRTLIETIGYTFWAVLFARNNYERGERILDWLMWTSVGALLLPFAGRALNRQGFKRLQKLGVTNIKALEIPFERLEHYAFANPNNKAALMKELGLKDVSQLPKVAKTILRSKLLIVGMNLFLLAAKGQAFYWGKNLVTEYLSGRKGFVGEFNIADKAYTKQKAESEERTKRSRQIISIAAGLAAVVAAPLWINALVKSTAKRGPLAYLKKLLPHYNYADAIYLGKAVLIFHNVFNWFLPSILSARDNHERREVLFKNVVFDLFYFLGDQLIATGVASWLQSRASVKKQLGQYSTLTSGKNFLGISFAKDYSTVFKEVEAKIAPAIALKLARINFWSGILGTSLGLGIATTLLNNWYTKQKVLQEEQELELKKQQKPLVQKRSSPDLQAKQSQLQLPQTQYSIRSVPTLLKQPTEMNLRYQPLYPQPPHVWGGKMPPIAYPPVIENFPFMQFPNQVLYSNAGS